MMQRKQHVGPGAGHVCLSTHGGSRAVERTQDTRLPFMLRTLAKPSLPSCAAYLPDLAPAVLQGRAHLLALCPVSRQCIKQALALQRLACMSRGC